MTRRTINNDVITAPIWQYAESKWLKIQIDEYIKGTKKNIDSLDKLYKGITELSLEDAKSLLFIELTMSGNFDMLIHHDDDDFKNLLAFEIKKHSDPIQRFNLLIDTKIKTVLPEAYIGWFKNDLRASLYFAGLIEETLKNNRVTSKGSEELLVYISDNIRLTTFSYMNIIRGHIPQMKHRFNESSIIYHNGNWTIGIMLSLKDFYLNNMTTDREVRWIESTDEEQIQYLYERMIEQKTLILKQNFFPRTTQEMYVLILASLDSLSNCVNTTSEDNKKSSIRDFILYLLKKAWK